MTAAERRAVIMDEAGRLFAFKGLHGTTTKEIAKAAGISEPVLYQHFRGKDDIYVELERICSQQTAYFKRVIQDLGPGLQTLVTITYLLIRIISFSKQPGAKSRPRECSPSEILLRLMGYSFLEDGRFAATLVQNCIGSFFDQWHESYRVAAKEGLLTVDRADATALWLSYESLIGMGMFTLPPPLLVDKIDDADASTKAATLFLLRGMGLQEKALQKTINWTELRRFYQRAVDEASLKPS